MRKRILFVPLAAAGIASLAIAAPAQAVPTTATVTVAAGALSITAPVGAGSLGTINTSVDSGVIRGQLGVVQVDDSRAAAAGAGWIASVISTAFTPPAGPTIPAASVGYTAGPITQTGTATYTANDPVNLTGASPVVTATGITGDNRATWNPTINVTVQGSAAPGVYSAIITHSVV
jgi:hypothetical protein